MNARADLVGDDDQGQEALGHEAGQLVAARDDRLVAVASQQTVRHPEGQTIEDGEIVMRGEAATSGDDVECLFHGGPRVWPLGAMTGDARPHVAVEALGGGDESRGAARLSAHGERALTLAAPGAAEDELRTVQGRDPGPPAKTGW